MPRPSHSSWFYHPHNSGWGVPIMKLLIVKFPSLSCYLVPLRPKYSQHPIIQHPQPTFLPQCQRPSFTLHGIWGSFWYKIDLLLIAPQYFIGQCPFFKVNKIKF
jgi:hypothetical protein